MNIANSFGPIQPVRFAPPATPTGGIPVVPGDAPPTEQVTLGQTPAAAAGWNAIQTNNQVNAQVLRDQGGQVNKALVATLSPGPLLPCAVKLEWNVDPQQPLKASLVDRPDVKLNNPVMADDGQIYVQLEPGGPGSNPSAPFLVFNPQTLSHGLSDGMRQDGQGGFTRSMQEYQNTDGSFMLIANEQRKATPEGLLEKHFTRVDVSPTGMMKATDIDEAPTQGMLAGGLSGLWGQPKPQTTTRETPATDVRPTQEGLQITHGAPAGSYLPSLDELKEKAGQIGDQATTAATNLNHKTSGLLKGRMKEFFDFGMGGGLLGKKGHNVGQGLWNKATADTPPVAPQPAPPRISLLHPFSPVMASNPGALFPGLATLLSATAGV